MKEISIEELKRDASQWVRLAASNEPVLIADGGKPVATLIGIEPTHPSKRLPNQEAKINQRSQINVEPADYLSEMRD